MRILCAMLICFTAISSSFAEENKNPQTRINYLIYERGWLINQGNQDILRAAVISPFYKYLGDIPRGGKVNLSFIRNKFTVECTLKFWIGEYETMQETFIPNIYPRGPDVGLDMKAELKGDVLSVSITSAEKIQDIFIELLPDIPVKISNDRTRYVLSSVGTIGQNLKRGPQAEFKLCLIAEQKFYKLPVQITYVFRGSVYDRVFTFSFRKEDFSNESTDP